MPGDPTLSDRLRWRPLRLRLPRHKGPGTLIAVEGIDGSGKSTLCSAISAHLETLGRPCLRLMSPSAALRVHPAWQSWHQDPISRPLIDEFGLAVMSMGDRLVQQSQQIIPALEAGHVVIADRYLLSTLVYWCTPVHAAVLKRLIAPDLGIWLDTEPTTAARRIQASREEPLELRDPHRLTSHRRRYRRLVGHYGYVTISTEGGEDAVWSSVHTLLDLQLRVACEPIEGSKCG